MFMYIFQHVHLYYNILYCSTLDGYGEPLGVMWRSWIYFGLLPVPQSDSPYSWEDLVFFLDLMYTIPSLMWLIVLLRKIVPGS